MPNPKQIQINIPNPCSQPWEEMTPCGQGRFCGHCQKTVIDFTAWSDAAMYRFFSENTARVCGRFLATQVHRPIHIPPQPHSRLYRMMVALGLTLIFTQATDAVAQNRPPRVTRNVSQTPGNKEHKANTLGGEVRGRILGEDNMPLVHATVVAAKAGAIKARVVTDVDGYYVMQLPQPGYYDIVASNTNYDSSTYYQLLVQQHETKTMNFNLNKQVHPDGVMILTGDVAIEPPTPEMSKPKAKKSPVPNTQK